MFELWLSKLPNGISPSLTLKKKIFNILLSLNFKDHAYSLEKSELYKIVEKNKRSITKDIRELSEAIVLKWNKFFRLER